MTSYTVGVLMVVVMVVAMIVISFKSLGAKDAIIGWNFLVGVLVWVSAMVLLLKGD